MEHTPIQPVRIELLLSGETPAHDIVPQMTTPTRSLLLWALQNPMTASQAASIAGIPTMLTEEELDGLAALEAIEKYPDGKYAASFYIETLDYLRERDALADRRAPEMREILLARMGDLKEKLYAVGFMPETDLFERQLPALMMHLLHDADWTAFSGYNPPLRPDGARYYFMCSQYDQMPAGLKVYDWYSSIPGLEYRTCAPGNASVMRKIGMMGDTVAALCRQLHDTGRLDGVSDEIVAELLRAGVAGRRDGALTLLVPWFTRPQFQAFLSLASALAQSAREPVQGFSKQISDLLKAHMPAHLLPQSGVHQMWAVYDLLARVMRTIWPKDAPAALGLLLVER